MNLKLGSETTLEVSDTTKLKSLDLRVGVYVKTTSYSGDYLINGTKASGGQLYEITTLGLYRAKTGNPSYTPDGVKDFYLNNGNLAVHTISDDSSSSFTDQSIPYANGGILAEDNANLKYNPANQTMTVNKLVTLGAITAGGNISLGSNSATSSAAPATGTTLTNRDYVTTLVSNTAANYLPLSGGTLTGSLQINSTLGLTGALTSTSTGQLRDTLVITNASSQALSLQKLSDGKSVIQSFNGNMHVNPSGNGTAFNLPTTATQIASTVQINTGGASLWTGTSVNATCNGLVITRGNNSTGLTIATENNYSGNIAFADPENNLAGLIQYSHPTDEMRISTGGSNSMTITGSAGNTTVTGWLRSNTYFSVNNQGFMRGDTAGQLRFQGGSTSTTFYNNANSTLLMTLANTGGLTLNTGDLTITGGNINRPDAAGAAIHVDNGFNYLYGTNSIYTASGVTELVRFPNAGGMYVGRMAHSFASEGFSIDSTGGEVLVRKNSGIAMNLSRGATDGGVLQFYRDTAAVGNINITSTVVGLNSTSVLAFQNNGVETFRTTTTRNILVNTTTDIASSLLTLESTTQGMLFPRMTTTQRNAIPSPANGLTIYNITTATVNTYNGSSWQELTFSSSTNFVSRGGDTMTGALNVPDLIMGVNVGALTKVRGNVTNTYQTRGTSQYNSPVYAVGSFAKRQYCFNNNRTSNVPEPMLYVTCPNLSIFMIEVRVTTFRADATNLSDRFTANYIIRGSRSGTTMTLDYAQIGAGTLTWSHTLSGDNLTLLALIPFGGSAQYSWLTSVEVTSTTQMQLMNNNFT